MQKLAAKFTTLKLGIFGTLLRLSSSMATDSNSEPANSNEKSNDYLPHYFYKEQLEDAESKVEQGDLPKKPLNKIAIFTDSDSSDSDSDDDDDDDVDDDDDAKDKRNKEEDKHKNVASGDDGSDVSRVETKNSVPHENQTHTEKDKSENQDIKEAEPPEPPAKKQCIDANAPIIGSLIKKVEDKSDDKLIEAELPGLGDKSKKYAATRQTMGHKAAKKKSQGKLTKEVLDEIIKALKAFEDNVERFLRMREYEILTKDTSKISEEVLEIHKEMCAKIEKRWKGGES